MIWDHVGNIQVIIIFGIAFGSFWELFGIILGSFWDHFGKF